VIPILSATMLLAILGQGCSTDPVAFPAPTIACSSPLVGNPWFLTYFGVPHGGVGGTADCCVMIGIPAPSDGSCAPGVLPVATVGHWMPLRGNPVVVVMPTVPNDPSLRGLDVSVQALIVGHIAGRPDPVALTNASGFRIG